MDLIFHCLVARLVRESLVLVFVVSLSFYGNEL